MRPDHQMLADEIWQAFETYDAADRKIFAELNSGVKKIRDGAIAMITKYGYIARAKDENGFITVKYNQTEFVSNRSGIFTEIPEKAWVIPELGQYPEVYFMDREKVERFLSDVGYEQVIALSQDKIKAEIIFKLFGLDAWRKIVYSFGGVAPEIEILDMPTLIASSNPADGEPVFSHELTPENLKIRLRMMLDESGRQVSSDDFYKLSRDYRPKADQEVDKNTPQVCDKFCVICGALADYLELDMSGYKCKTCSAISKNTKRREQVISRLVEKEFISVHNRLNEYEIRIRRMTDDQIEKEYRMEFGE